MHSSKSKHGHHEMHIFPHYISVVDIEYGLTVIILSSNVRQIWS